MENPAVREAFTIAVKFNEKFERGYLVWKEISEELLFNCERDAYPKLLLCVFESLYDEAKFQIFKPIFPKDSDWKSYYDCLMHQRPWHESPRSPMQAYNDAKLPEPIFTNLAVTTQHSIVISIVFGGVLRPEVGLRVCEW